MTSYAFILIPPQATFSPSGPSVANLQICISSTSQTPKSTDRGPVIVDVSLESGGWSALIAWNAADSTSSAYEIGSTVLLFGCLYGAWMIRQRNCAFCVNIYYDREGRPRANIPWICFDPSTTPHTWKPYPPELCSPLVPIQTQTKSRRKNAPPTSYNLLPSSSSHRGPSQTECILDWSGPRGPMVCSGTRSLCSPSIVAICGFSEVRRDKAEARVFGWSGMKLG